MKTALKSPLILALVLSTIPLLIVNQATAQAVEQTAINHQGWYQVEMIIFSRKNPALQEHFPNNIQLHYPARWQTLKDPNPVMPPATTENTGESTSAASVSSPTELTVDFNTQAFYQLPADMRQLNFQADKFSRSIDYQLLFHQAWRQPISNKNQADWILIHNSNSTEPAPKLAGAIRLSVATYFRLDTNLWFAEFEPKLEEIENPWPELPENPEIITQDIPLGIENPAEIQNDAGMQTTEKQNDFSNAVSDSIDQTVAETWQTKRIVLVKEKRDMRSNEVHYIDHPILGVIIKITPFKPAISNAPVQ
jgi:Peptidoglycan-binding protein, CsiV